MLGKEDKTKMIVAILAMIISVVFVIFYSESFTHNLKMHLSEKNFMDGLPLLTLYLVKYKFLSLLFPLISVITYVKLTKRHAVEKNDGELFSGIVWLFSIAWILFSILVWRLPFIHL